MTIIRPYFLFFVKNKKKKYSYFVDPIIIEYFCNLIWNHLKSGILKTLSLVTTYYNYIFFPFKYMRLMYLVLSTF